MLSTVFKVIVLGIIVIAAAWGLSWVLQNGGDVPFQFQGREYRPSLFGLILTVLTIAVLFWLFIKLVEFGLAVLAFILGDKNAMSRFFGRRRQKRGMDALETSALALAAGDSRTALAKAYRADKDLDRPVITSLLVAQAAKAEGKSKEVEAAYKKLLETSKAGRFVGIRGLMEERKLAGDTETASKLAKKALELQPGDKTTINSLFDMQIKEQDWQGARATLKAKAKYEKMPSDVVKRREAVLAISEAQNMDRDEQKSRYDQAVSLAYRLAPNLVPAAVLAASTQAGEGNMRAANNIIVKSWNHNPHPDLAETFAQFAPNETPAERLRRFKVLTRRQKSNPETRMLQAELLIANEDFPGARRAMGELGKNPETARQLAIMAAIEHGEGADDTIVRAFLARATKASRGEQWVCNNCGEVHGEWHAVCGHCDQFDTIDWKTPPESVDQDNGIGVLLPLLMSSNTKSTKDNSLDNVEDAKIIDG